MHRSGVAMAWNVFKFCIVLRGLGSVMILLVLGVVGVTYYTVVFTNYGPALYDGGLDSLIAVGVLIIFHCLLVMLLWSYFSVVLTDPGGVPPNWRPAVDEERGEADPLTWSDFNGLQPDLSNQRIRYCRKCNQLKPPRCHHCSVCGRCVLKMDHHCVWVVHCVGALNYKYFLLFLPIYGFASGDPLRFKRAAGHKDLFYIDDKDVEFKDVIEAPLPRAPLDVSITAHWLAIEGVQPAIPENASVEALAAYSDVKKSEYKEDGLPVEIKLPVKHVLSRELQLYFEKITELTRRSSSTLFKEALVSLATDSGLHALVPYFTCFVADEVTRNLNNFPLLFALMRLVRSLLQNPHIHIEPYLQQLMPSVITCLVAKRLGNRYTDNHWELRNFTANLVSSICKRFGHVYHNLQPRLTRTLLHAFLDPTKALSQHYGAIQGLAALGPTVVRLLILPNLDSYMQLLEPEMILEKQKNEIKRQEAWRVYGALLNAAGQCMHDRLKLFHSLLSPPAHAVWKRNGKVATTMTNKRKASTDNMIQQPPLKKLATDGAVGAMPMNSMQVDMQGAAGGFSTSVSMSHQLPKEHMLGREVSGKMVKGSTVLAQAWKEETDAGHLMASLFEYFGEGVFSFTPKPELSFFL